MSLDSSLNQPLMRPPEGKIPSIKPNQAEIPPIKTGKMEGINVSSPPPITETTQKTSSQGDSLKKSGQPDSLSKSSEANPLSPRGRGMDKSFYLPHKPKDGRMHMGFLSTSPEVKTGELRAYRNLSRALEGRGIKVPVVIDDTERSGPVIKKKSGSQTSLRGQGYWIEYIENMVSFKPIMAAIIPNVGGAKNPIMIYKQLLNAGKVAQANNMKDSIKRISENIETICNYVGELTLGINPNTGDVYLVDVSPNQGQIARDQAVQIKKGLDNLYAQMKEAPPNRQPRL